MNPLIASVVFAFGILGLFVLDRDPEDRTSKALWIAVVWLLIAGSRNVGEWLQPGAAADLSDPYLEGNPVDRMVLAGLLTLGLIVLLRRRSQIGGILRANATLLLFFSYCGVSTLWSDYPYVAFKRWTRLVGDLVMALIVLSDPAPSAAIKRLVARTGFLLLPLSVLLIKYFPDLGRQYGRWDGRVFWTGVTTHKNSLGMICLVFGLGCLWRFLRAYERREGTSLSDCFRDWLQCASINESIRLFVLATPIAIVRAILFSRRTRQLIAQGVLLSIVLWLIWIADSATSFASLLLAGSVMVLMSRPTLARKPALVHLLVLAALSVPFYAVFVDAGANMLGTLGRNSTLTGRTQIWNLVLSLTDNPLFGTGFESFWLGKRLEAIRTFEEGFQSINEAHNGYLEIYLNLGWTGLGLLALVLVTGYRNVVGALRRDPPTGALGLAYFIVAVVYNFSESAFKMMSPVWIFFLLAAISLPETAIRVDAEGVELPTFGPRGAPCLEEG